MRGSALGHQSRQFEQFVDTRPELLRVAVRDRQITAALLSTQSIPAELQGLEIALQCCQRGLCADRARPRAINRRRSASLRASEVYCCCRRVVSRP